MGERFLSQVSTVSAIDDAIDGTAKPQTRKPRDQSPKPAVLEDWKCPACFQNISSEERVEHMVSEWVTQRDLLRRVRDLLGPEPLGFEETEESFFNVPKMARPTSPAAVAKLFGLTDSRIRQFCRLGLLPAVRHGRSWIIDWEAALELNRQRKLRQTGTEAETV